MKKQNSKRSPSKADTKNEPYSAYGGVPLVQKKKWVRTLSPSKTGSSQVIVRATTRSSAQFTTVQLKTPADIQVNRQIKPLNSNHHISSQVSETMVAKETKSDQNQTDQNQSENQIYHAQTDINLLDSIENSDYEVSAGKKDESCSDHSQLTLSDNEAESPNTQFKVKNNNQPQFQIKKTNQFQEGKLKKLGRQASKSFGSGKNQKLVGLNQAAKSMSSIQRLSSMRGPNDRVSPKRRNSLFQAPQEDEDYREENLIQTEVTQNIAHSIKGGIEEILMMNEQNLRSVFIEQYGVSIEFPVYYFHQAKFVPNVADMVVTLGFHTIPKGPTTNIQTTYLDDTIENQTYDELYGQVSGLMLTLQKQIGQNGFEHIRQIRIKESKNAYIEFSRTGNYLSLIKRGDARLHTPNVIAIFDSRDINKCIDDIENDRSLFQFKIEFEDFGSPKYFKFDGHDKYFAITSRTAVAIMELEEGKIVQQYKIDNETYSGIYDVMINSNPSLDEDKQEDSNKSRPYRCQIACKLIGLNTVKIFDIAQFGGSRQMSYFKNVPKKELIVKISDDFEQVCLSNGVEHYIHNDVHQQIIPYIKDKFIRYMQNDDKDFYLVTTKDYDRDIDILNTNNDDFHASIIRSSTPGVFKVFDSIITQQQKGQRFLKYLTCLDDKLYLDTVDIKRGLDPEDEMEGHVGSCVEQHYSAFGFNWPYFSYATTQNFIMVLNAFNPKFVQRYEMPETTSKIVSTFLADSHDVYVALETTDEHFQVYQIDLDSTDPKLIGPLIQYSFDQVDHKQMVAFHARSSSVKEKINLNKSLIFYMMHGTTLWSQMCRKGTTLYKIDDCARNLYYQSDDEIFYLKTVERKFKARDREREVKVEHSTIFQLQAMFGSTKQTAIYVDNDPAAEILNFGVDNVRRRLIILSGIKNNKDKRDKYITLFDFSTERILYQIRVTNREIIGRLKSNLYNFVDGHIYYGNKVIKIRYDQIDKNGGGSLCEEQLFDYYDNILSLGQSNNTIQLGTPLQTTMYHRLAYIISNQTDLKPRKILILPYLHERKIILNRRVSANQFYTIYERDDARYILCMCISDNKMYVYTETGILVDRILYRDLAEKCGKPDCMSEDAKFFIFRKCRHSIEAYLVQITLNGLKEWVHFNIKDLIEQNMSKLDQSLKTTKDLKEFWQDYLQSLKKPKNNDINFQLNDNGDVLIRIKPNKSQFDRVYEQKYGSNLASQIFGNNQSQETKNKQINSIFFYICNNQGGNNYGQHLYYDGNEAEEKNYQGVSMNQKYIFFWNLGKIWKLSLETKKIERLSLYISEEETETYIKNVRCGSNQNIVSIIVRQSPILDYIIIWDIAKDLETQSFDVDNNVLLFQDKNGQPYIAQKDYIINCSQGNKLKTYCMQVQDFDNGNAKFGFSTGHRVETDSHNFMIFRNFINMSFSYMSFVIKDNFELFGYSRHDYLFDKEGYDYIINKRSLFFEGNLVTEQYENLKFILKNYEKVDPELLETLLYKNEKDKIPLHLALEANNTMMVNLILGFMQKIDYSAVGLIKNIFKDLISFHEFAHYLETTPFQTMQMVKKQTLRIRDEANDDEIIRIASSTSSYVDSDFFKEAMKESDEDDRDSQIYATNITCIRADWILNQQDQDGEEFLKELLKQQNKHIFMTPYVKIIIEFLYEQYRNSTIKYLLPSFLIQLTLVFYYIFEFDRYYQIQLDLKELELSEKPDDEFFQAWKMTVLFLNLLITIYNIFIFTKQALKMKWLFFKRGWTFIEITIIISNLLICSSLFITYDRVTERYFEVLCVVTIMSRSLYFFRLFGEVAPLIDIIFVILNDIFYFMIIYGIALTAFVIAFYVMGQNQMELELTEWKSEGSKLEDKPEAPQYFTLQGAFLHVYISSLGEFDVDDYTRSGGLVKNFLLMLFFFLSFFMCIHMLNMLIAIMGNSFERNSAEKEARKNIAQLQFVVENWWIDPIKNKEKIVYIIAASHPKTNHDNEEMDKMFDEITSLRNDQRAMKANQKIMMEQIKSLVSMQKQGPSDHCHE